jgi:hypothetical protein
MFINIFLNQQIVIWKREKENLQDIIVVQMYEIVRIHAFSVKLLDILINVFL